MQLDDAFAVERERRRQLAGLQAGETTATSAPLDSIDMRVETWREFERNAGEHVPHLVEGLWPEGALGFVSAPPKSGKTWLALALALSVASGQPFAGGFPVERPRAVLYVALEGARAALRDRTGALARGLGVDPDGDGLDRLSLIYKPLGIDLADPAWTKALASRAREVNAALVVVDVLRAAAAFNENDAAAFSALARSLAPLTREGRSVGLLHHFTKLSELSRERQPGERMSGSGAMYGALDVGLFLTGYDRKARSFRVEIARRDGAEPDPFGVRLAGEGSGDHGSFVYTDTATLLGEDDVPGETELKAPASAIREYLLAHGGEAKPGDIVAHFGISESTLRKRRDALKDVGVGHVQQGPTSRYVLVANPYPYPHPSECGLGVRGANPHEHTESTPHPHYPAPEAVRVTKQADLQAFPQPAHPHSLKGDAPPVRVRVSATSDDATVRSLPEHEREILDGLIERLDARLLPPEQACRYESHQDSHVHLDDGRALCTLCHPPGAASEPSPHSPGDLVAEVES